MTDTIYILSSTKGGYEDRVDLNVRWFESEPEAMEVARRLEAELTQINLAYRTWLQANPLPTLANGIKSVGDWETDRAWSSLNNAEAARLLDAASELMQECLSYTDFSWLNSRGADVTFDVVPLLKGKHQ